MKSSLLAVLLPLLFLSAEYNEVSARKKLQCYVRESAVVPQTTGSCEGDDVVCFADTFLPTGSAATIKACGERSKLKNDCEKKYFEGSPKCTFCGTDLCNNQPLYWA